MRHKHRRRFPPPVGCIVPAWILHEKWLWGMDIAHLALLRNRSPMVFLSPPLCIVPSALHPDILPRIFYTKKAAHPDCCNFCKKNGGGGWIRTIEGMAGRFTVYCIWPLCNPTTKGVLCWKLILERVKGIEPSQSAWKADVLPLNYTRNQYSYWLNSP